MIRLYAKAYMSEARVLALRGANDYSSNVLQSNTVHKGAQTLRQSKQKSPKNGAKIGMAETERFELSCRLLDKRISSASRYDHFGTSPKHT